MWGRLVLVRRWPTVGEGRLALICAPSWISNDKSCRHLEKHDFDLIWGWRGGSDLGTDTVSLLFFHHFSSHLFCFLKDILTVIFSFLLSFYFCSHFKDADIFTYLRGY